MQPVLVATLGAEPQVITLATALLQRQGNALASVTVVHTDPTLPPVRKALTTLREFFNAAPSWPPLRSVTAPVTDVLTAAEFEIFGDVLYAILRQHLAAGQPVHLLLAGGRKSMAMAGLSVAQLLLGDDDHVWHLYSEERVRLAEHFVPAHEDDVRLVEIPITPATGAPARFTRLMQVNTPGAARQTLTNAQQTQLRRFVYETLTPAEREVAALAAREVLTAQELAGRLDKSVKTVANQLNSIYSKLESVFDLQPDMGVKREFLRHILAPYFQPEVRN